MFAPLCAYTFPGSTAGVVVGRGTGTVLTGGFVEAVVDDNAFDSTRRAASREQQQRETQRDALAAAGHSSRNTERGAVCACRIVNRLVATTAATATPATVTR